MITEIWIEGQQVDLYTDSNIRHVKQVNNVADVKFRQASYTNSFTIPKTPNNIQIFGGLGLTSDTSRIPYNKPSCQVKLDGFDLIVKGWFNITETTDEYKIYVQSGIIDFFKAIEGLTIGNDLDISGISHEKNVDTVIGSYLNPDSDYKYFIADYNGKRHFGENNDIINIDYLQPSVRVSYLWEKIHKGTNKLYLEGKYPQDGFNYLGEIFNSDEFNNLYLTYPKAFEDESIEYIPIVDTTGRGGLYRWSSGNPYDNNTYCHRMPFDGIGNKYYFKKKGRYKITINLNLDADNVSSTQSPEAPFIVYLAKNNSSEVLIDKISDSEQLIKIDDKQQSRPTESYTINRQFDKDEFIELFFFFRLNGITINWDFTFKIEEIKGESIDYKEQMEDFQITDFVKEIINRFGLTMFPDEFSNEIVYKTLNERINKAEIIDWSDKYIERESEEYIANSYAQKNSFEYQYNDKEGNYNDGYVVVNNRNLEYQKTVLKSKTYSPEVSKTMFFLNSNKSENVNIFKFYDKEVNEDKAKPIKYKPLQKRYYFIRGEQLLNETVKIGSDILKEVTTTSGIYIGSFEGLGYQDVTKYYYKDFEGILNDSRIHNFLLNLNIIDLFTLSFDKLYYFKQEQQYYILNKLQYDNKSAKGEFVRVKFTRKSSNTEDNKVIIDWIDGGINSTLTHTAYSIALSTKGTPRELVWQRNDNDSKWLDVEPVTSVQKIFDFVYGKNQFRVKYVNGVISDASNTITYQRTLEVDPNKCYEFDLKSPVPKTVTVVYKNFDNIEITKELIFYTAGQVITISGKQLINTGGIDDIIQRAVPCPVFECHRYYISTVGGSGDDLTVTWTDCNGVEHTDTQYSNAPGTTLSLTICAREGQFSHNSRNDARDEGVCSG
ncbi:hypothetical protein [Elizabethkingia anophelis]|uniref:hypothetical protein n=1 Tax=Elizabethkingia anophelis TaxID=1117645 RepID=UPI003207E376